MNDTLIEGINLAYFYDSLYQGESHNVKIREIQHKGSLQDV